MGELFTELLNAGLVNQEEVVGLSLARKTSSEKSESGEFVGRTEGLILDLQDIALDIVEIQRRGIGGPHLEG